MNEYQVLANMGEVHVQYMEVYLGQLMVMGENETMTDEYWAIPLDIPTPQRKSLNNYTGVWILNRVSLMNDLLHLESVLPV